MVHRMYVTGFSDFEKEIYEAAKNSMICNLNKLGRLAKHENAPGAESWFQWEFVLSKFVSDKWCIKKDRDVDLKITDLYNERKCNVELKCVTAHDFNTRVKKWYFNKNNKYRMGTPILFISREHQEKQIKKLKQSPEFLCDYEWLGDSWIIGICKPTPIMKNLSTFISK